MRLLVTRPEPDAAATAAALRRLGHEPVLAPLMAVVPRPGAAVDLAGLRAVLATSANGVRAFAAATARRDLPLFAVGAATGAAAREAGFARVEWAEGDVTALAALVRRRLRPEEGPLLHVAGSHRAGDLAGDLGSHGYDIRRAVLYEARTVETLPRTAEAALASGTLGGVLLFSPRTAAAFVSLVDSAGLGGSLAALDAYCLSAAVAEAAGPARWRTVRIAVRPEQEALLALLGSARAYEARDKSLTEGSMADDREQAEGGPAAPGHDAADVVARFGGIRPMAAKLGVPVTTVQGWKERGTIPASRWPEVAAAAKEHGVDLGTPQAASAEAPAEPAAETEHRPENSARKGAAAPEARPTPWASGPEARPAPEPTAAATAESERKAEPGRPPPPPPSARPRPRILGIATALALVVAVAASWQLWWPALAPHLPEEVVAWVGTPEEHGATATLEPQAPSTQVPSAPAAEEQAPPAPEAPAQGAAPPAPAPPAEEPAVAETLSEDRPAAQEGVSPDAASALAETVGELRAELEALRADLPPAQLAERTAQVEERLAGLDERLAQAAGSDAVGRIDARIADLAARLDSVDLRLAEAERTVRRSEATDRDATTFMLAVFHLRQALERGAAYGESVQILSRFAGTDRGVAEAIAALRPAAERGVPTRRELAERFETVAAAAVRAETASSAHWTDRILARLSEVVTVRPSGPGVEGEDTGAVVARAEQALAEGELARAVELVAALQGPAADTAAGWLAEARARLAADGAAAALSDAALRRLAEEPAEP